MRKYLIIALCLLIIPLVAAQEGKVPLLAVRQIDGGLEGSSAELFLEIKEGTGRVFVDTFPLSELDTQISIRFAKEIACDFLDEDCDDKDFIYTIRADTPIIGGPSAGAAATMLTVAVLTDSSYREDVGLTGTINSGGLIGFVGGVKEKIEASADTGLKTVLIPQGENTKINKSDNNSIDIIEFGEGLGVEVIEVIDLNDALRIFTGKEFRQDDEEIEISSSYKDTMKGLAVSLCERNSDLKKRVKPPENDSTYDSAVNLSQKGDEAFKEEQYYAAASYCFGSNVRFNEVFLEERNFSTKEYRQLILELGEKIDEFERFIESKEIKTITDLESFMVVKERLEEARRLINVSDNASIAPIYAFANERLRSAYSWAEFFNNEGRELELDEESLRASCRQRISEAEERLQYAALNIPLNLNGPRADLKRAYEDFNNDEYALCLFRASKAKAEANIVLNSIGVSSDFIPTIVDTKLNVAARVIVDAGKKDIFPVLGYSYFEYANNLKESDRFSALLYAEYALELSNLDIYFKEKERRVLPDIDTDKMVLVVIGIVIGIVIGLFIQKPKRPKKKSRKTQQGRGALLGKKR
ncbi:hypothetical protein GOV09_02550 [Candidatus Woesearchaeota archaeon]|nr:hypothetical protein [Candidatus Woesearchaeota archaeon]